MQKTLELTLIVRDGEFDVEVYEPESGDYCCITSPLSYDEHPEFDEKIGNEIYSWISLMADEMEDEEYEDDDDV